MFGLFSGRMLLCRVQMQAASGTVLKDWMSVDPIRRLPMNGPETRQVVAMPVCARNRS